MWFNNTNLISFLFNFLNLFFSVSVKFGTAFLGVLSMQCFIHILHQWAKFFTFLHTTVLTNSTYLVHKTLCYCIVISSVIKKLCMFKFSDILFDLGFKWFYYLPYSLFLFCFLLCSNNKLSQHKWCMFTCNT